MKYRIATIVFLLLSLGARAQDPQNMKVENSKVDCEKIARIFTTLDEAKTTLEKTTFSFSQDFKTSKKSGVMAAHYYTCDNETGFLWIKVDNKEIVYKDVPRFKWKELIETNDLDTYYSENIRSKFPLAVRNQN